jgi:peptidoglycan/xylan/chitin deacetylase (PgdA/CDA1 family)
MRPAVQLAVRAWAHMPLPREPRLMVLGYHRVAERDDDMTVRPSTFAAHVGRLVADRKHVPVVDLDHAVRNQPDDWPRRAVALTLDDAWMDVHTNGLPVLVEATIPATLYVPSGLLGSRDHMTRTQVCEWIDAGMTVGGHSRSHSDLRRCNDADLERETRGCRENLEDLLGVPVTSFAYPFGHLDRRVRDAVAAAGFTSAVSTRRGWSRPGADPLRIPRCIVEDFDVITFRAAIEGGLSVLRAADAVRGRVRRNQVS